MPEANHDFSDGEKKLQLQATDYRLGLDPSSRSQPGFANREALQAPPSQGREQFLWET
jgi:hypothetical protein